MWPKVGAFREGRARRGRVRRGRQGRARAGRAHPVWHAYLTRALPPVGVCKREHALEEKAPRTLD
jgi:hypothetical protein